MTKTNEFNLGLDIGTSSVGFAAADEYYNLIRKRSTDLWGVNLFTSASLKKERRGFRASRRRKDRKKELGRILLEDIFREEIEKVDRNFFQRLEDSFLHPMDKHIFQKNSLLNDKNFDDKEYYKKYPTIYHLRSDLVNSKERRDIRLIYLAMLNMLKRRGHFLSTTSTEKISTFDEEFGKMTLYLKEKFEIEIDSGKLNDIENILKQQSKTKSDKRKELQDLIISTNAEKDQINSIISGFCGLTTNLNKLFKTEEYEKGDKFAFSDFSEVKEEELRDKLSDNFELIECLRGVYNWMVFSSIMIGKNELGEDVQFEYLSDAMVNIYEQHNEDLKKLKKIVKKYIPDMFETIFLLSKENEDNYVAYAKKNVVKNKKQYIEHTCTHESFLKYLDKKVFTPLKDRLNDDEVKLYEKLKINTLLRKQRGEHNATVPYQINLIELKQILNNQKEHYSFLKSFDSEGYNTSEKIISIFTFRIPYYIGPLNNHSPYAWIERDYSRKITPWNFDKVVNIEKSAENFIVRMTNRCTYLYDKNVIPKNSLLYQKYMILNDLNNLKVNDKKLSVINKQKIFNEHILRSNNITLKSIRSFLISEGLMEKEDKLTGLDKDDANKVLSFKTYHDFKRININNEALIEEIVNEITLFGAERKMLMEIISKRHSSVLSDSQITNVVKLNYSGWGQFSKEVLTELMGEDKQTGEVNNIINYMWEKDANLMQLLSNQFTFLELIEEHNVELLKGNTLEDNIESLKLSQPVNKMIRKTFKVVNELVKIIGKNPDNIFVETTRSEEEKRRTVSRKGRLEYLYKESKLTAEKIYSELMNQNNSKLQSKRVYLYFAQLGKCMYTGEGINIDDIFNNQLYDVDHIYPRSKIQDDSLHHNLVLVKRDENIIKTNNFPISSDIQNNMKSYWDMLLYKNLISKEKHKRLTRVDDLSPEEIDGFINRQLVETSQATKAVATLLKKEFPNSNIVYVKAKNVSEFRQKYDLIKSREINDHHHAKDAYLNIVVGNVFDKKFIKRRFVAAKEIANKKISLNKIYDYDIENAWSVDEGSKSISTVKKVYDRNTPLVVREVIEKSGGLFNQQIRKKTDTINKDSLRISIKNLDKLSDFSKYGYYDNVSVAYYSIIEHTLKKKREKTIVPIYKINDKSAKEDLVQYCEKILGLVEPKVVVNRVGVNTVFEVNGKEMMISGKTNNYFFFNPKFQLIVSKNEYTLIHNCISYLTKVKVFERETKQDYSKYENKYYTEKRGNKEAVITNEKLNDLYDVLTDKLNKSAFYTVYNGGTGRFNNIKNVEIVRNFECLDLVKKCSVIHELVKMLLSDAQVADLSMIGLGKIARIQLPSNFINNDKYNSVNIVNYSSTGFFKQRIKIK